jgi:hypothetical protein
MFWFSPVIERGTTRYPLCQLKSVTFQIHPLLLSPSRILASSSLHLKGFPASDIMRADFARDSTVLAWISVMAKVIKERALGQLVVVYIRRCLATLRFSRM